MSSSERSKLQLHAQRPQGAGVVTESVAFKLVCDMQHLRGKVDIMCNLGATFAQRWVEEVVQRQSPLLPHEHQLQQQQQQQRRQQAANADAEARLRDELEELVLELVDTSVEIQRMKERKDLALRFFCLAERRPSWSPPFDEEDDDEKDMSHYNVLRGDEREVNKDEESAWPNSRGSRCDARTMMQLIDLDECEQVIDRLTTVLLGYLTAGEREEEERAICKRHHLLAAEASAQGATMRLPFVDEDDMFR
jgi:uncharacterized protein YacL (UPF0231 family)